MYRRLPCVCFQLQAFEDVERDMSERETPMDRLICGDVGFGKTEVALRAIFRAVGAGRQVMVLAPTTVLAKQHYKVISARFAAYPDIHVGLLSRFQKETERREILERIKEGTLHIVAGTHSLLGAQVSTADCCWDPLAPRSSGQLRPRGGTPGMCSVQLRLDRATRYGVQYKQAQLGLGLGPPVACRWCTTTWGSW